MLIRAFVVWLLLMALAVANGTFREVILVRHIGTRKAHAVSTLALCILIGVIAWILIPWIDPRSASDAQSIGALWLALTLAFEFGLGRLVAHKSWSELLADYNLLSGRIWLFVPLTVLIAPYVAARVRDLL